MLSNKTLQYEEEFTIKRNKTFVFSVIKFANIQIIKKCSFTKSYWEKLKSLAKEWSTQCIEKHERNYVFKSVYSKIHDKEAFGKVHSFLIKLARFYHFAKGGWRPTS